MPDQDRVAKIVEVGLEAGGQRRVCVLVLGMHRSGTSALTRILSISGARLPADLMGAARGNEAGHWESNALVQLHDGLLAELGSSWSDWRALDLARVRSQRRNEIKAEISNVLNSEYPDQSLFVVKDPRICRFASLFLEALDDAGIDACIALPIRNPLEVIESLERRDGMARADAALLWLRHVLDADAATRSANRAFVSYASLLADWRTALETMTERTGADWPYEADDIAPQIDGFLAPAQRHHARSTEDVLLDPLLKDWVGDAYSALLVLERNPLSKAALAELDRIRREFNHACPIIHRLRGEMRETWGKETAGLKAAVAEAEGKAREAEGRAERLAADDAERDKEIERLRTDLEAASGHVADLTADLVAREQKIERMRAALATTNHKAERIATVIAEHAQTIAALEAAVSAAGDESSKQTAALAQADGTREELSQALAARKKETAVVKSKLTKSTKKADSLALTLKERDEEANGLRTALLEAEARAGGLAAALAEREEEAARLTSALAESKRQEEASKANLVISEDWRRAYENSTSWKLTRPLRSIRQRQIRLTTIWRVVPHALRLGGGAIATSVKALRILRTEGIEGLGRRIHYVGNLASMAANLTLDSAAEKPETMSVAEFKRRTLEAQQPFDAKVVAWTRPAPKTIRKFDYLRERLRSVMGTTTQRVILSITHDDYTSNLGGVQLCVQVEEEASLRRSALYLVLCPHAPLPALSRERQSSQFIFQIIANGSNLGAVTGQDMTKLVNDIKSRKIEFECVIHALLGHSPEVLVEVLKAADATKNVFWLHDYFSICPSPQLLRNEISYCGAPDSRSAACTICHFGEERLDHLARIQALFNAVSFEIAAPSTHALELWRRSSELPFRNARVEPHCILQPTGKEIVRSREQDAAVRVAFLGHPAAHKGWHVFAKLVTEFGGYDRYEFHHLGQTPSLYPNLRFTPVRVSASMTQAMVHAIVANEIDVVLLWAIWPETFSFTFHEAVAGGALVLTSAVSGNIQAQAKTRSDSVVLSSEAELFALFGNDELERLVRAHRSKPRVRGELVFNTHSN
ncbi:MAG: hypothetical protein Q8P46_05100 [Hyphomicrobiales bacterium]|nr:hypothetical protein [Hyphomicrobiales bacterium]